MHVQDHSGLTQRSACRICTQAAPYAGAHHTAADLPVSGDSWQGRRQGLCWQCRGTSRAWPAASIGLFSWQQQPTELTLAAIGCEPPEQAGPVADCLLARDWCVCHPAVDSAVCKPGADAGAHKSARSRHSIRSGSRVPVRIAQSISYVSRPVT